MKAYEVNSGQSVELGDVVEVPAGYTDQPPPGGLMAPVFREGQWVSAMMQVGGGVSAQVPALVGEQRITVLAFLSRFSDSEAVAIDLASIGATTEAAGIRRYMSKVNAANYIDLMREDTQTGVQALEVAGLIAEGRAVEILDAPIRLEERTL